jgi:hypothetical protein
LVRRFRCCAGDTVRPVHATHKPGLKAAVSWYDRWFNEMTPKNAVDIGADVRCPVLAFYGGQDKSITPETIEKRQAACKAAGKTCESHVYPDAQHGFPPTTGLPTTPPTRRTAGRGCSPGSSNTAPAEPPSPRPSPRRRRGRGEGSTAVWELCQGARAASYLISIRFQPFSVPAQTVSVIRRSGWERRGCADSRRSRDHHRTAQIDPSRSLSLRIRNGSSCPITAVHLRSEDCWGESEAVIRSGHPPEGVARPL